MISLQQKFILIIANSGLKRVEILEILNCIFLQCVIFVGLFNLNQKANIIKSLLNERCIYSDNSCAYLGKET